MKKYESELHALRAAPEWTISDLPALQSALNELIATMTKLASPGGTGTAGATATAAQDYFTKKRAELIRSESALATTVAKLNRANAALAVSVSKRLPPATIDPAVKTGALIAGTLLIPGLGTLGAKAALDVMQDRLNAEREMAAKAILTRLKLDLENIDLEFKPSIGIDERVVTPKLGRVEIGSVLPVVGARRIGGRLSSSLWGSTGSGGSNIQSATSPNVASEAGWSASAPNYGEPPAAAAPGTGLTGSGGAGNSSDSDGRPGSPGQPHDQGSTSADGSLSDGTLPGGTLSGGNLPGGGLRGGNALAGYGAGTSGLTASGLTGSGLTGSGFSGGAASAAALAASARLSGAGGFGMSGGGSATGFGSGTSQLGSSHLGSSGLAKLGGGGLLGNGSGASSAPGGSISAAGENSSGSASGKSSNSMMGGQPGGAGIGEKEKRSGLGGLMAPKLEEDDAERPQSAAALAGGRTIATQKTTE